MSESLVMLRLRTRIASLDAATMTVAASWAARLVTAGTQLITIPMLTQFLGIQDYSIYVVLISLVAWYALADFGTGYALQNTISRLRAHSATFSKEIISSVGGLLMLLPILLVVLVALAPTIAESIWPKQPRALEDLEQLLALMTVIFVLTAVGNVGYRILYAEQQGWVANVLQGLASLVSLVLIAAGTEMNIQMTPEMRLLSALLAYSLPQTLLALAALGRCSFRSLFSGGRLSWRVFRGILRSGGGFLVFGFLSLLTLQVDYFVLSRTVDVVQIVQYSVIAKVMGIVLVFFQAMLQAHWPHSAEEASRGEWAAVNARRLRLLRFGTMMVLLATVTYAFLEQPIMRFVSPQAPDAFGPSVVALYGLYLALRVWSDTHAMVLQSIGRIRVFLAYVPLQAVLSVGLQIAGAQTWGVAGLIAGLSASFLLTSAWILPVYLRRIQRPV